MQEIRVSAREEGGTLLKWLGKYLKTAPTSFFYKMLRKKNITLNGTKAEGRERLVQGDVIRLFLSDDTIRQFGGAAWLDGAVKEVGIHAKDGAHGDFCMPAGAFLKKQPEILYEDDDILFVGKPAGWLTQKAGAEDFSLNEWILSYLVSSGGITPAELATFRPSVCNRLDRNTSGIVTAGKTLTGLQFLSEAFHARALKKYYTCMVVGDVFAPAHLTGYLKKDGSENIVHILSEGENAAAGYERVETAYRPLAAKGGITYLEVELLTGKTHQIRAQLASAGHVLLGDTKYTDAAGRELNRRYHLKHQLLHAGRIVFGETCGRFSHLGGKEFLQKEPEDFLEAKRRLGF